MATGKFGDHFSIDVAADGRYRVLASACRSLADGGREVQADEIQVEILITKDQYLALTGAELMDRLRTETAALATMDKATDTQKRFSGLTISS